MKGQNETNSYFQPVFTHLYQDLENDKCPKLYTSTTHRISFSSIRPFRSMSYIEKKSSVFRTGSFVDVILTAIRNSTKSNQRKKNLSDILLSKKIYLHTNIS